jgi:hypothetical protein
VEHVAEHLARVRARNGGDECEIVGMRDRAGELRTGPTGGAGDAYGDHAEGNARSTIRSALRFEPLKALNPVAERAWLRTSCIA